MAAAGEWDPREHRLDAAHFIDAAGAVYADEAAIHTADAAWAPFARSRRMVHERGSFSLGRARWPRIEALVDGVPVALEILDRPILATAASARPPVSMSGHLEVRPADLASRIARLFGVRGFQVGDPAFHRDYVVQATDDALALALLSPIARREARVLGCRHIVYDDGSASLRPPLVRIELPGVIVSEPALDRVLRLVILLARAQGSSTAAYR